MSSHNKGLLQPCKPDKNVEQFYIEMEQINPRVQKQLAYQQKQDCKYQKLKKQDDIVKGNPNLRKLQEMPPSTPFNPKIITMNGQTFRLVQQKQPERPKPKKANIPTMLVTCYECQTVQSVPGTSSKFLCGLCNTTNQCLPSHDIIRCFNCNTKTLYSKGQSQHIRCTKCRSINRVPREIKEGWGNPVVQPIFYPDQDNKHTTYAPNPYIPRDYKEYDLEELSEMETLKYPDM